MRGPGPHHPAAVWQDFYQRHRITLESHYPGLTLTRFLREAQEIGGDGQAGELLLKGSGDRLRGKGTQPVPAGERLIVRTPGGGGLGDRGDRSVELVSRDARDGTESKA